MPKTSHDIYNARKVSDQFRSGIGINMHLEATGSRSGRHSLMVPVPLPPADVKANSVMSCFFLPQVNSSKTWSFKPCQQNGITNRCYSSHSSSVLLFEVKPTESGQLYIFHLETVRQQGDACSLSERRGGGLYVLPCAWFPQGIYSWLFILFLVPIIIGPVKAVDWSLVPDLIK